MAKINIVTDSSAALTPEEIRKYNIQIIPMTVSIGDENFIDGVEITREEFIKKMDESKKTPRTAQPPIGRFEGVYSKLVGPIVSIHISSGLSGTVNVAKQAADLVENEVLVIDSKSIDRGLAFQVIEAAKAAEQGNSLKQIEKLLKRVLDESQIYLSVISLDNLIAGGRISKWAGTIGGLLNIKVGLQLDHDGNIQDIVKGRGIKTIDNFFNEIIEKIASLKQISGIGVSHADNKPYADEIIKRLKIAVPDAKVVEQVTSPIVATHTAKGAVALIYYGQK